MKKPLKVGFDLDGVLLYNPVRIARKPVSLIKKIFLPSRRQKFIIPQNWFSKIIWEALHLSSLFVADGFYDIERLVKEKKIQAYIITARYNFLQNNTEKWLSRLNKKRIFTSMLINKGNEQPHLFKKRLVDKLGLDIFVEDNFDIVSHLRTSDKTKIFWIYNVLDRYIDHNYKFPNLKKAVAKLESFT